MLGALALEEDGRRMQLKIQTHAQTQTQMRKQFANIEDVYGEQRKEDWRKWKVVVEDEVGKERGSR